MLASPTSRWSAGAVLLTVLVLVASWFLLIGPRRDQASSLNEQTMAAQTQAATLQTQIAQLRSQFGDLPKLKAELAGIKEQLPSVADMPSLVRNLQNYAAASGVSLDTLSPGTPTIFTGGTAGAAGAAAGGVAQAGDIVEIPLNATITGDYFEDALFVKSLQTKLTRAFLVSGLVTAQSAGGASIGSTGTSTATATLGATPGAIATPANPLAPSTPAPVVTAASSTSLQISGSVFVLADDTTSLSSVAADAKAAAKATSSSARTSASATAASDS